MDNIQKLPFVKLMHDFIRTQAQNHYHNEPKQLPCHVSKILENDFLELTFDMTGPYTLPKINVPQTFSKYHREPTQVGDKGYHVSSNNYLGGESGQSGGTASPYLRGNLTTGAFQPVSEKQFPVRDHNNFLITGGPTGITAQSADTKTNINIDFGGGKNSLIHNAVEHIMHTAGTGGNGNISHIIQAAGNMISTVQGAGNISHSAQQGSITHNAQQIMDTAQLDITKAAPAIALQGLTLPTRMAPEDTIVTITGILNCSGPISGGAAETNIYRQTINGNIYDRALRGVIFELAPQIIMANENDTSGATEDTVVDINGDLNVSGSINISGSPVVAIPELELAPLTVTGSRQENAALANLLIALQDLGLIIDNTTLGTIGTP
jgi:hypothetical protein